MSVFQPEKHSVLLIVSNQIVITDKIKLKRSIQMW